MANSDERRDLYVSPWADEKPGDQTKAMEAGEALGQLLDLYHPESMIETRQEEIDGNKRMLYAVEKYAMLSIRAVAEGLTEEVRQIFIKEGLLTDGILSLTDSVCADQEFRIISRGYDLNRPYFDRLLGRSRRFKNDILDIKEGK